jgi:hypothetical protein
VLSFFVYDAELQVPRQVRALLCVDGKLRVDSKALSRRRRSLGSTDIRRFRVSSRRRSPRACHRAKRWMNARPSRWASSLSIARSKRGIEAAYDDAQRTMAGNMMQAGALEGAQASDGC